MMTVAEKQSLFLFSEQFQQRALYFIKDASILTVRLRFRRNWIFRS